MNEYFRVAARCPHRGNPQGGDKIEDLWPKTCRTQSSAKTPEEGGAGGYLGGAKDRPP